MKYFWIVLITSFLTAVTQIGGLIYLLCVVVLRYGKYFARYHRILRWGLRGSVSMAVYIIITVVVVPPLAGYFGRIALPVWGQGTVRPLSLFTPLCNRHYVDPRLYRIVEDVATAHPQLPIAYLDANFPFWEGFPLLPHLSHDDGRKIDFALQYRYPDGRAAAWRAAAPLGYGAYVAPRSNELSQTARCKREGYWQYDFTKWLAPFASYSNLRFDETASRTLIAAFANHHGVGKLFLEPHLKRRLNLQQRKIRFHGCQAVRHDDHLHVQL